MSRREAVVVVGILAGVGFGVAGLGDASAKSAESAKSSKSAKSCVYELETTGTETGTAVANIGSRSLRMRVRGAVPNTMYTIWTDHRKRVPLGLTPDYPPTRSIPPRASMETLTLGVWRRPLPPPQGSPRAWAWIRTPFSPTPMATPTFGSGSITTCWSQGPAR